MNDGNVLDWGRPEGTVTLMLRSTTPSSRILVILISMLPPGYAEARGYHAGAWEPVKSILVPMLRRGNASLFSFPRSGVGMHSSGVTRRSVPEKPEKPVNANSLSL